jgi:stress-induced morphogen
MGAHNYEAFIQGQDEAKFVKEFNAAIQQSRYEDGHSSYSGGIGTLQGVKVVSDPFPNMKWTQKKKNLVYDHLLNDAEKWEYALAVKTTKGFIVAAWLAS